MRRPNVWNYFSFGALILSILTFALLFLSEHSYWLMRLFFAVALPVSTSLILFALYVIITGVLGSVLASILEFRWRIKAPWKMILWIAIFTFSSSSFSGSIFTSYKVTASASFDNQNYYLIKFLYVDTYSYKLYHCESLSLFCSRSSSYIGIPYQNDPISLHYNSKTQKVYIQNANQIIPIPD